MKTSKKSLLRVALLALSVVAIGSGVSYASHIESNQPPREDDRRTSSRIQTTRRSTKPQTGHKIVRLPSSNVRFVYKNKPYYFAQGVIYTLLANKQYEVVNLVEGMIIPSLPLHEMQEMVINRNVYYEHYGVIYKPINTRHGREFEVVGWME